MSTVNGSRQALDRNLEPLTRLEKRQLAHDLADGTERRSDLARKYRVTPSAITHFAQRHAAEIEDLQAVLFAELNKSWIAHREERILAYQAEFMKIEDKDHHEWVKAKLQILRQVAEEMGQLPPRMTTLLVPVVHVVEGIADSGEMRELLS